MPKIIHDGNRKLIEVAGLIKRMTEKAILFDDGIREAWVPLSQIENDFDELGEGAIVDLLIPEWLAMEKNFI